MTTNNSSLEVEIAVLKTRMTTVETRCKDKEKKLELVQAWQNKALGYAVATGFIAALLGNYIASLS